MSDLEEIRKKSGSSDPYERRESVCQLRRKFVFLSDKQKAWEKLIRYTDDEDSIVRHRAVQELGKDIPADPGKTKSTERPPETGP